ncbi:DUF2513 domain-containing protein [Lentibacillus sediminis]|uniref:DUF2513 domain-containing protein n=1 Tax=Lentibacillus sediminis TaxID=1940529 RepID=UPI000C1C4432|nr:DUF2513 domain-containing protein [Lentibacillus sediminis]
MKRDMEIIKRLMLLIENQVDDRKELKIPEDIDRDVVAYHLKILDQAGYTVSKIQYADNSPMWIHSSLTWDGHEFLSVLKNDQAVKVAKVEAEKKGTKFNELPFEVIKGLLIASSKQLLGL